TPLKISENNLKTLNRKLQMLVECSQMLVHATEELSLLQKICRIVVEVGRYRFAWVGLAEHDKNKSVRPIAWAGYEEEYLKDLRVSWADIETGQGPTGTAIRTGKPVINRNILVDPQYGIWRSEALKRGYASSVALPLIINNQTVATLNIYASIPDAFDSDEVDLLRELAGDVAYGMTVLRSRIGQSKTEAALSESEERFRRAFETAGIGMALVALDGRWLKVNRTLCEIVGYSQEELLSMSFQEITHPDDLGTDVSYVQKMLRREILYYHKEKRYIHKQGHSIWVLLSAALVSGGGGEPLYFVFQVQNITDRKKAEEAQARFAAILEATPDFVGIIDADGNTIYINKAGKQMLELADEENIIGKKMFDFLDDASRAFLVHEAIPAAIRDGIWSGEATLADRKGKQTPLLLVGIAQKKDDGSIAFLAAIARDITERKIQEEALRRGERFLSSFFLSIQDGISILDKEMNIVRVNPVMEKWYAHAMPLVHKKCYDAYHSKKHPCEICPTIETIASGKAAREEVPKRGPTGEIVGWLDLYSFPLIDQNTGTMQGVIEYVRDITDRKKAEEALRESDTRFKQIADNAHEWIWEINKEGLFVYSNRAVEKIMGYTVKEVVGEKYFYDFFAAGVADTLKEEIFSLFGKKEPLINVVIPHITKNGITIILEKSGTPIIDDKGNLSGYRGINIDITKRKALEDLKEDFINTISHELKTPLSITKESINLVFDKTLGDLNEKQEKILGIAKNNIDRLAHIITKLLDISRIEAGERECKRNLVDIVALTQDVTALFKRQADEKGLIIKLNFSKKSINAYIDKEEIKKAFINLLENALRFTQKGFIEVAIKELENALECRVTDTGVGITQENMRDVFDKFQQFQRSPGAGEKGTGLGLSIVKGIVKMHKGHIWIESEPGKGTSFIFTLPTYTAGTVLKDILTCDIEKAAKNNTKVSLVMVSMPEFDTIKQNFLPEKLTTLLAYLEEIFKNGLRRSGDVVVEGAGELVAILRDCDKENSRILKERLQQALNDYLKEQNLADTIRLRFGNATYPDDAMDEETLVKKAKEE
ncbi:MAG: PAS domain S-box protein, partial [Candidatus Omnitrophica bacterium]|nr:PAS domain S-box protein [Candidatus Omnitrophota bacterium]